MAFWVDDFLPAVVDVGGVAVVGLEAVVVDRFDRIHCKVCSFFSLSLRREKTETKVDEGRNDFYIWEIREEGDKNNILLIYEFAIVIYV